MDYYGTQSFVNQKDSAIIRRQSEINKIRSLYLSGVPLFTKEQIYTVRQQLKELGGKCGKVIVTGLNGNANEFDIRTGVLISCSGVPCIFGKPFLVYCSIQNLTSADESSRLNPAIALCSLHVCQNLSYCDKLKKEVDDSEQPGPCFDKNTVKDIFNTMLEKWEKSKQCKDLRQVLQSTDLSNVKQIVAFACGSMRFDSTTEKLAWGSLYQHGLILTIRKVLQEKQGLESPLGISTWVQDPAYCAMDTSILTEFGISTLNDPDGFLEVDHSTMVLSFAPNVPVKQIITEISRPAAMIWNRVQEDKLIDRIPRTDPDSSRVREMISQDYEIVEFLFDKDLFSDVALYVRRRETAIQRFIGTRAQKVCRIDGQFYGKVDLA